MKGHERKSFARSSIPFVTILLAIIISFSLAFHTSANDISLRISFINVGQGDSALLGDSSDFDILINGDDTHAGPIVIAYIRDQTIDDIDVMIASHSHSDQIVGLIDVLEATDFTVESVMYNGYLGDTATWYSFATAVADEGLELTTLQFPGNYSWGQMTVYTLNPISGLGNPDQNDASVVLLISHDQVNLLFTGDIGSGQEAAIVARGTPVAAEILKVPHHGSRYSSSTEFLSSVDPEVAIISVGANSYGHPAADTL